MLNMFWIQNINIFIDPRGGEMKIQLNYRLCKLCSQSNLRFVIANWCCLRTADCRLNIKIQLYLQQSSPRHPATSPSTPPHLLTLTGVTRLKLIVLWLNGGMFQGIFSNYPETKLMFIFACKKYWRNEGGEVWDKMKIQTELSIPGVHNCLVSDQQNCHYHSRIHLLSSFLSQLFIILIKYQISDKKCVARCRGFCHILKTVAQLTSELQTDTFCLL